MSGALTFSLPGREADRFAGGMPAGSEVPSHTSDFKEKPRGPIQDSLRTYLTKITNLTAVLTF
jgi:hypothetical protein